LRPVSKLKIFCAELFAKMADFPTIALAILAAGRASRFGGDKLVANLNGTPLGTTFAREMRGIRFGLRIAICNPAQKDLTTAFAALDYRIIANDDPDSGLSRSVSLAAVAAMESDADGLLICLADMPFVTRDHVCALITRFHALEGQTIASTSGNTAMPPALFGRNSWPRLCELSGDAGARDMLKGCVLVPADAAILADIDTRDDLAQATVRQLRSGLI
jgi:molybdenum cofactor cytidylyltransferase